MALLGRQAMSLQSAMTYGALAVGAAIAGAAVESVKQAASFDQSMHKVAGLTTLIQSSGHDMQYWSNQILALAPQIDVAPTKLAQALYFVASAGIPASQAMSVLKYSAMAAAATMGDMSKVADLVTSAMNTYKNQGVSAAEATNVIVDAVKNGKVEMHALETSFAFVATTGLSAKFSLEEVAAAVSTLTQVSGNTAARRVQMDLDNLIRRLGDVGGVANTAKKLRLPFDEQKFASEGLIDRLKTLMQMSGFTTNTLNDMRAAAHGNEQVFEQMALKAALNSTSFKALAGGAAAMIPSVILMNDKGKTFSQIFAEMSDKTDKVTAAFNIMRESTGQKWNMFEVTLQSLAVTIGLHLLPAVNGLLMALISSGRGLITWLQSGSNLNALKYAIIGIAIAVGAVLAPAIAGFLAAAAPVVLTIAGIVAGGILLGKIIQAVVAHFGGWSGVMKQLQPVIQAVQGALAQAGNDIKRAFADPAIQQAWKQLQAALPQLLPVLKAVAILIGVVLYVALRLAVFELQAIAKAIPFLLTYWTLLVDAVGVVVAVVKGIGPTFAAVWGAIRATVQNAVSAVVGFVTGLAHAIVGAFQWLYQHNTYVQAMVNLVVGAWRLVVAVVTGLVQGVVTWIVARWQWFATITGALWQGIVKQILTPILTAASAIWQAFQKGVIQPITDLMQGAIKAALDWGKNLIKQFAKGISQSANIAGDAAQGALKKAAGWLGFHSPAPNVPESAYWGSNLVRMFATDMQRAVPVVTRAAQQVMQAATLGGAPGSAAGALGSGSGAGGAFSLAGLGGLGGGPSTHYHNWAGAFPNATNTDQIMAALQSVFDQRERDTYRRGRRAGMGGGLRAGV